MKTHRVALERTTTPVTRRKKGYITTPDDVFTSEKLRRTTALKRIFDARKRQPVAVSPPQNVEVDCMALDMLVISNNRKIRCRPCLTAGICLTTRKIVAWHVGLEKPSCSTAIETLRVSLQKTKPGGRRKKSTKPAWGTPERIIVDNGSYFHSTSPVAATEQLQFDLPRAPAPRAMIERYFAQVSQQFGRLHQDSGGSKKNSSKEGQP